MSLSLHKLVATYKKMFHVKHIMSFSIFYGARILGIISDWSVTHLEIQKILYISHLIHLGRYDQSLFDEPFYAWKKGAVCAKLYQELAQYRSSVVREDIFINIKVPDRLLQSTGYKVISQVYAEYKKHRYSSFDKVIQMRGGAWYRIYHGKNYIKLIPDEYIKEEYDEFYGKSD